MSGRSATLDPRIHAVRPDLADVRLARMVFAPHYAACVERVVASATTLRLSRAVESEAVASVAAGDRFELLDLLGDDAWGVLRAQGESSGLVGYLDATLLAEPAQ